MTRGPLSIWNPLRRKAAPAPAPHPLDDSGWTAKAGPSEPDALSLALDEIEAGALAAYHRAGLPTEAGHYRQGPDGAWAFLAADLTPQQRFALALDHPPEQGWRFARLQDLGARSEDRYARAASRLLSDVAALRATRREPLTRDHLLMAMELGAAWRAMTELHPPKLEDDKPPRSR